MKKEVAEQIILESLSHGANIKDLKSKLKKQNINLTNQEIATILEKLSRVINIKIAGLINNLPKYKINEPILEDNQIFDIDIYPSKDYLDIMFTADYHIGANTPNFKEDYNRMLDYCEANNIKTILNLGDFFDFSVPGKIYTLDHFYEMQEIVENTIEKLPLISGMYQGVLGGNHDKWNTYLGVDYLQVLTNRRSDFFYLGNRRASVRINKGDENIVNFLLLHLANGLRKNNLPTRLTAYYSENKDLKNRYTCAFFGHSHDTYIDTTCGAIAVNSLSRGNETNGAMHVRFYFNSKGLSRISLKPIVIDHKKVIPTTEIIYRKRIPK